MSAEMIVALVAIYFVSSFVQGLAGFAFGMISLPLLALLFSPMAAVGMLAVLATFLIAYNYFLHRKGVEYRKMVPLCAAAALFLPVGAYFLHHAHQRSIMIVMGCVVASLTLTSIVFRGGARRILSWSWIGYGFAALSGLLGGAFSTPGPPIVVYLYATDDSRMRAKANAQFYFVLVSIAIVITHFVARTITPETLLRSLPFLPVVLAGVKLGSMTAKRLPVALFQRITDFALIALGVYLVIRNVLA